MDIHEAAQALSVAAHEILDVRHHAGWWEALHHDMASHEETWRPVAEAEQPADTATETADVTPQPVDDDPDGPGVDTDGDGVPEGSAKQILGWVGEDADKAKAALEAEQAKDKPRTGLVAALEKLVAAE